MQNLKWYAAFHNESHHPHVHLIAYSVNKSEGYLTKKGVNSLRSSFAKDIFAQDLLCIYEKQTQYRDELRRTSGEIMRQLVEQINIGTYNNPAAEEKLLKLAGRLSKTGGKKKYGYLKSDVKALIYFIVDELAADERIAALYDLWYEQREEVIRTYTEEMPTRIPLSQNMEFKSIRNAVIQEAMNLVIEQIEAEEFDEKEIMEEEPEPQDHFQSIKNNRNWSVSMGTIRLLHNLGRILQDKIERECNGKIGTVDRKLKRQIDEKKQAQGLRQG